MTSFSLSWDKCTFERHPRCHHSILGRQTAFLWSYRSVVDLGHGDFGVLAILTRPVCQTLCLLFQLSLSNSTTFLRVLYFTTQTRLTTEVNLHRQKYKWFHRQNSKIVLKGTEKVVEDVQFLTTVVHNTQLAGYLLCKLFRWDWRRGIDQEMWETKRID